MCDALNQLPFYSVGFPPVPLPCSPLLFFVALLLWIMTDNKLFPVLLHLPSCRPHQGLPHAAPGQQPAAQRCTQVPRAAGVTPLCLTDSAKACRKATASWRSHGGITMPRPRLTAPSSHRFTSDALHTCTRAPTACTGATPAPTGSCTPRHTATQPPSTAMRLPALLYAATTHSLFMCQMFPRLYISPLCCTLALPCKRLAASGGSCNSVSCSPPNQQPSAQRWHPLWRQTPHASVSDWPARLQLLY